MIIRIRIKYARTKYKEAQYGEKLLQITRIFSVWNLYFFNDLLYKYTTKYHLAHITLMLLYFIGILLSIHTPFYVNILVI